MRLINETPAAAQLVRVIRDQQSCAAALVVKATYDLHRGRPELSRRQRPVLEQPEDIAGARFEPETVLGKSGVDVLVVGEAQAPTPRARMMAVGLAIEGWVRQLLVLGDRHWRRAGSRWWISDPAHFETMPVSWARAFGGIARSAGAPVPHPDNPEGRGYALDLDERLKGQPLPNVEDPDDLLERPGQLVEPVSFAPLPSSSALRVRAAAKEESPLGVDKSIFNVAPPRHRLDALQGGERVELWGWAGLRSARFALPREAFVAEVDVGHQRVVLRPRLDTLCLIPGTQQLVCTHRSTFNYHYRRAVPRVVRLRSCEARRGADHVQI